MLHAASIGGISALRSVQAGSACTNHTTRCAMCAREGTVLSLHTCEIFMHIYMHIHTYI